MIGTKCIYFAIKFKSTSNLQSLSINIFWMMISAEIFLPFHLSDLNSYHSFPFSFSFCTFPLFCKGVSLCKRIQSNPIFAYSFRHDSNRMLPYTSRYILYNFASTDTLRLTGVFIPRTANTVSRLKEEYN